MGPSPAEKIDAAPSMGFWLCLALVVGNVIGTGIFLLPASLAPYGINALFGWLVTIGGGLCLAYVFATLARSFPEATGPYDYIEPALGAPAAFFVMWSYWISLWITNAAVAIGAVSYLSVLAPELFGRRYVGPLTAILFVLFFTAVATRGVRAAGAVQLITSILKLLPLIAVMVLALAVLGGGGEQAGGFAPVPVSAAGIAGAAALTLWAMLGLESATLPSGKVRDPRRTVPRATLIGTLLVGLIYLLTSLAVFMLLPAEEAARSSAPFADLAARYWGSGPASLIAAFAAISALGALNGWVLLQAEVPLSLARRGLFPSAFGRVNRRGIPIVGQLLGCFLTCALIALNLSSGMTELFEFVILLATAATLVLYLFASTSALALRARGHDIGGGATAAAAVGAVFSVWTLYGAGAVPTAWGAVLLASGVPVYLLLRRRRTAAGGAEGL